MSHRQQDVIFDCPPLGISATVLRVPLVPNYNSTAGRK